MLAEKLEKAWRERLASVPIDETLKFAPEGLVFGAGTVLASASGPGRDIRIDGHELRIFALLSAAHLKPVRSEALKHVRRAIARWNEGQDGLARVHLALSRLERLDQPDRDAKRLFLADGLIHAGIEPEAILRALDLDASPLSVLTKAYNWAEPRVPKGSGRPSGRWTDGANAGSASESSRHARPIRNPSAAVIAPRGASRPGPTPGSTQAFVGPIPQIQPPTQVVRIPSAATAGLSASELAELALFAGRFAGPAAALGMLLIPTNKSLRQEGYLPGYPPIRYLWHTDERSLILASVGLFGVRWTDPLEVGQDGLVRNHRGQVVGRVLANSVIVIDRASVGPRDDPERYGPTLCPPASDEGPGRGVAKDRDYEDYVKKLISPRNPTPRGFSVILPNPSDHGEPVKFDDCHGESGAMIEAKGTGFAKIFREAHPIVLDGHKPGKGVITGLLDQAKRQIEACEGRAVHWYFAEQAAADKVRDLFKDAGEGRERIKIIHLPWKEGQTWKRTTLATASIQAGSRNPKRRW